MSRTSAGRRGEFRVLIAGGGVAGLEAALALRDLADGLVGVELLAPEHHFFYRPLAVAEPFGAGHVNRWELDDRARAAGAQFTPGSLEGIDSQAHVAHTALGLRIEYDAVAETIAVAAGAGNEPRPFAPVLRALLLTGGAPTFLRVELGGGHGESSTASNEPLWWPPGQVVGRHLAPFLAELGVLALPTEPVEDALRVELEATAVHELGWPR